MYVDLYLTNTTLKTYFFSISQSNVEGPVIVSSVKSGLAGEAIHFVRNAQIFMPNTTIVLFDLGMSEYELQLVLQYCNSSTEFIFNNLKSDAIFVIFSFFRSQSNNFW